MAKRRHIRLFDEAGQEVIITMACMKCHRVQPFDAFGIRKMADGAFRNIPWCRTCRGGYGVRADGKGPL